MAIATINRFIALFRVAFDALAPAVSMLECERLAMMVHRSMDPKTRSYHTAEHVFFMCEGMNSHQILAALFHDVVYFQLDGGFPEAVAHTLDVVHCEAGVVTLGEMAGDDMAARLCAELFGFRTGDVLGLYTGLNEFLSALVAARLLQPHISGADLVRVVAAIEATIPFRAPLAGRGAAGVLAHRVAAWLQAHSVALPAGQTVDPFVRSTVRDAVMLANRDVSGFAQANPALFLSSTWLLIEESNAPLRSAGIYSVTQYRAALMRMEGFLLSLNPADIFQSFDGVPGDSALDGLAARARTNILFACDFLDAKLVAIAVVEALALRTGTDCPVSMFLGDISSPYGRPHRAEDHLPQVDVCAPLNPDLLTVFEDGRSRESSYDLTSSPLTAFIYRSIGHDAMRAALVQAKAMFAGALTQQQFLQSLEPSMVRSLTLACAEIAMSRRSALLALAADF